MSDRGSTLNLQEFEEDVSMRTFPLTREDLLEQYEDTEIALPGGAEPIERVLDRLGIASFESHDELIRAIKSEDEALEAAGIEGESGDSN